MCACDFNHSTPTDNHPNQPPSTVRPTTNTRQVNCKWKDGNYYAVRILERRPLADWDGAADEGWEYYVHYHKSESAAA